MAVEVMNRVEKKYVVDTYTYRKLLKTIGNCTELDSYNKKQEFCTISNIYFDTDDNHLIRTSLSKPGYKEKLRLRAYGIPTEFDRVYLEIKKKHKGITNKRRTALELAEAYEFAATGIITPNKYMNKQVLSELAYFIRLYKPIPKLYLAYDRRAYFGENGLRITFDKNIRTRRYDLKLEKGDYGEKLIDDDLWLIEVKAAGAIPLWLTKLLSEYKVYCTSFSKYGTEYQNFLRTKTEGDEKCLNQFLMPQAKRQPSHCKAFLSQLA